MIGKRKDKEPESSEVETEPEAENVPVVDEESGEEIPEHGHTPRESKVERQARLKAR